MAGRCKIGILRIKILYVGWVTIDSLISAFNQAILISLIFNENKNCH